MSVLTDLMRRYFTFTDFPSTTSCGTGFAAMLPRRYSVPSSLQFTPSTEYARRNATGVPSGDPLSGDRTIDDTVDGPLIM